MPDEELPVAGGRDRAGAIVGVGAGADDGRVADAAPALVGHAAGRRGRRQVAVGVQRHGTHGRVPAFRKLQAGLLVGPDGLELPAPEFGDEPGLVHELQFVIGREAHRPLADEHDVRRVVHDAQGRLHRMADAFDRGDCAGIEVRAVHDRGVHFHGAGVGQHRTPSGVELGRVLEDADGGDHRVDRRPSLGQHFVSGVHGLAQ